MLILLQPGIQPLGQFDIQDGDINLVVGGEVAVFQPLDPTDGYASDVRSPGPAVQLYLNGAYEIFGGGIGAVWGFVDDGSSAGLSGKGYGTTFGQMIGATVGQGTGIGSLNSGAVVIGPSTIRGSGKVTLWDKPGLYGVTRDAFATLDVGGPFGIVDAAEVAKTVNTEIFGLPNDTSFPGFSSLYGPTRGKLFNLQPGPSAKHIGYSLGAVKDTSLVSTPSYYAGATPTEEYWAIYQVRKN